MKENTRNRTLKLRHWLTSTRRPGPSWDCNRNKHYAFYYLCAIKNHFCTNSGKVKVLTTIKVHRARSFPCSINHPQVLQLPPTEQDTCPSPGFAMGTLRLEPRLPSEQFESTRRQLNCNFAAISQRSRYVKNSNITAKLSGSTWKFPRNLILIYQAKNPKRSSRREYYVVEK